MKINQSIINSIKGIIKVRGTVDFPYKTKINEWMGTISIGHSYVFESYYINHPQSGYLKFEDIDAAVNKFVEITISKKNLGIIFRGIRDHKLIEKDFDDLSDEEIKTLINKYNDNYFEKDFLE